MLGPSAAPTLRLAPVLAAEAAPRILPRPPLPVSSLESSELASPSEGAQLSLSWLRAPRGVPVPTCPRWWALIPGLRPARTHPSRLWRRRAGCGGKVCAPSCCPGRCGREPRGRPGPEAHPGRRSTGVSPAPAVGARLQSRMRPGAQDGWISRCQRAPRTGPSAGPCALPAPCACSPRPSSTLSPPLRGRGCADARGEAATLGASQTRPAGPAGWNAQRSAAQLACLAGLKFLGCRLRFSPPWPP